MDGLNSSPTLTTVSPEYRSTWQTQDIYNATLQGDHILSNKVSINWSGVYSIAKQALPEQATYNWNQEVYWTRAPRRSNSISNTSSPPGLRMLLTHRWQHNTDQDWAGYGNLIYRPTIFKHEVEFETGGLYRYKTRTDYNNYYALQDSANGKNTL